MGGDEMDPVQFLDAAKADTEIAYENLLLPYKPQKGQDDGLRVPSVWRMRLSKSSASQYIAPYTIHQVITTDDKQEPGQRDESTVCLRSVFCVYNPEDEEEGSLMLLTMIQRLKNRWLKNRVIDGRFELDMKQGLQVLIYPEDTKDFYMAEMVSYWKLPPVRREIIADGYNYN